MGDLNAIEFVFIVVFTVAMLRPLFMAKKEKRFRNEK
jgi:hypothetical protein